MGNSAAGKVTEVTSEDTVSDDRVHVEAKRGDDAVPLTAQRLWQATFLCLDQDFASNVRGAAAADRLLCCLMTLNKMDVVDARRAHPELFANARGERLKTALTRALGGVVWDTGASVNDVMRGSLLELGVLFDARGRIDESTDMLAAALAYLWPGLPHATRDAAQDFLCRYLPARFLYGGAVAIMWGLQKTVLAPAGIAVPPPS